MSKKAVVESSPILAMVYTFFVFVGVGERQNSTTKITQASRELRKLIHLKPRYNLFPLCFTQLIRIKCFKLQT